MRIDWARQLIEVGRREDAIEVLMGAREIAPAHPEVSRLLQRLGADLSLQPVDIDDGPEPVVPNSDRG